MINERIICLLGKGEKRKGRGERKWAGLVEEGKKRKKKKKRGGMAGGLG